MKNKLYVGNLPYQVNEDELRDMFTPYGTVNSARVISDSMSGRSKGFGFVEFETEDQAKEAIDKLDGTEIHGRSIRVAPARPPEERRGGGRRSGGFNRGGNRW